MLLNTAEWKARGPCHLFVVQLYESMTKSEIWQGCVKAAECWIYRIIGFSRLNKQNIVTKINKTRFFVILEITFFCGSSEKDLSNIAKWPRCWQTTWTDLFVLLMGPFSYCLKRQTGELVPFSPKIDVGYSKNYEHLCGVWFLKVMFMIKITEEKLIVLRNGRCSLN